MPGCLISPAPYFLLRISLAIFGLLCFYTNFENPIHGRISLWIQLWMSNPWWLWRTAWRMHLSSAAAFPMLVTSLFLFLLFCFMLHIWWIWRISFRTYLTCDRDNISPWSKQVQSRMIQIISGWMTHLDRLQGRIRSQFLMVWDTAEKDVHTLPDWRVKRLDNVLWYLFTGMRKITVIGIFIVLFGTSLVVYSISQTGNIDMENRHLIARGTLILGFVMMVGGGLIALSPFGRKWCGYTLPDWRVIKQHLRRHMMS